MVEQSFQATISPIFHIYSYLDIYGKGFCFLVIVYFLSRQLTAPLFFASTIADMKLNDIRAPLKGAANAYKGFSNMANRHCTAIVIIIKAMVDSCNPSRIVNDRFPAKLATNRYGRDTKGANRIKNTATTII